MAAFSVGIVKAKRDNAVGEEIDEVGTTDKWVGRRGTWKEVIRSVGLIKVRRTFVDRRSCEEADQKR